MRDISTIQPSIDEPLSGCFSGALLPTFFFDAGSSTAFAVSLANQQAPMNWWRANECTIAGVVGAIGLLTLVVAIIRIVRRPQSRGRLYCPHCNHDLTPATTETPVLESSSPGILATAGLTTTTMTHLDKVLPRHATNCPACGTNTHDHPPLHGKSMRRRLVPWIAILVPLIAAAAWRCGKGMQFSSAGSQPAAAWLASLGPDQGAREVRSPSDSVC